MIETATGVVLRTWPFSETSLVVHWLTREHGRLATVAKGARRPKSVFLGKLDLFYLGDFGFSRSRRSELHTLREVSLKETHPALRRNLNYLQQASYCAALVERFTELESPMPGLFQSMTGLLAQLPQQPVHPQTIFAFELKLLGELGLEPNLEHSLLTGGTKQLVKTLSSDDWSKAAKLKLSAAQTKELQQFLHGFLIYHLGGIPKGREAALG